jgi:hypothetical protein
MSAGAARPASSGIERREQEREREDQKKPFAGRAPKTSARTSVLAARREPHLNLLRIAYFQRTSC